MSYVESMDLEKNQCKICGNSLLCVFVNYAWEDSDDTVENYTQCKARGLMRWLASENLNVNKKFWYSSNKLDARTALKIFITDYVKSNEDIFREAQDFNNKRMYAKLAYDLRFILRTLMNCNDNANYVKDNGQTVLHVFIEEHKKNTEKLTQDQIVKLQKLVNHLIERKAPLFANDKQGKTPIHLASMCRSKEILRIIIESLPDVQTRDKFGNTALHIVLDNCVDGDGKHKDGYAGLIRTLVSKGANVNARNNKGVTPVHLAAEKFCSEVLRFFARNGANFDGRTGENETPLQLVCKSTLKLKDPSKVIETFNFLVAQGCDLSVTDKEGHTLLHLAVEFSSFEIVKKLIKLRRKVDDSTIHGVTPLHLAVARRNLDIVKVLLARRVNVNFQSDALNLTALQLAVIAGDYKIARILMENGADVNQRGSDERMTALHMALAVNIQNCKKKCRGNASYFKRFWPKKNAVSAANRCDFVSLLLKRGADVNVKDVSDKTPLHLAALFRKPNLIRMLLDAGAYVNVQDRKGKFPIHNVWKMDEKEGLKLMLDFGADINDVDTSEMFMGRFNDMRELAVDHARKLWLVGLPIAKAYEPDVNRFVTDFSRQCSEEATNLMSHCDADGFSLYRFLRMNMDLQYRYIDKIQNSYKNLEDIFPIYGRLIRGMCRESAIRRQLLGLARTAWIENSGVHLPEVCVKRILDYLNNRYLDVLRRVEYVGKV